MMLLRRSLSAASSPFKQVAAVRSFTARNNDFVEIREHLRALDNCLTELRVGTLSPHVGGLRRANIYHLGKLNGLISKENLAQKNESDSDVKIIEDGGIDVQQLEVMIQDEGVKTRSTIQDEEKKNRLIDAIWKLGNSRTYDPNGNSRTYEQYTVAGEYAVTNDLLRSILRAFLAGEEFHVKADDVGLPTTLSVIIVDLTGTAPKYKVNANNGFMIYHG